MKVVNNHQIVFDYQEMAIIKKFNKALDNIGGETIVSEDGRLDISLGGDGITPEVPDGPDAALTESKSKRVSKNGSSKMDSEKNHVDIKVSDPEG